MSDPLLVKLIKDGDDQLVVLPREFHFDKEEVYITRDQNTGDITISEYNPNCWEEFFERWKDLEVPEEFMATRPGNVIPVDRDLFGDVED